jgi:hypothetical protein
LGQSGTFREHRCHAAVLVSQVDASDSAPELLGEAARGAAQPTANVKNVLARVETSGTRKFNRRFTATNVELVNRREVLGLESVEVFPRACQGRKDDRAQVGPRIMLLAVFVQGA